MTSTVVSRHPAVQLDNYVLTVGRALAFNVRVSEFQVSEISKFQVNRNVTNSMVLFLVMLEVPKVLTGALLNMSAITCIQPS